MTSQIHPELKRIGETGQISVGKALAGKLVRLEPTAGGILLRFVVDVPEADAWWAKEPYKSKLKEALAWSASNPPAETDLAALLAQARSGTRPAKRASKKTKAAVRKSARSKP